MKKLFNNLGLVTAVILMTMTACQQDEDQVVVPEGVSISKQSIPFDAALHAFDPAIFFKEQGNNEEYSAPFTATGVSSVDGMNTIELVQSHLEITSGSNVSSNEPNIEFRQGEFLLSGEDGNTIYGTYHGYGERYSQYMKAELFLIVEGGTGIFEGSTGHFKQRLGIHAHANNALQIELEGEVYVVERI